MDGSIVWEVEWKPLDDKGHSSFFETRHEADGVFMEAKRMVWRRSTDGVISVYKVRLVDMPRIALVVALLNKSSSFDSRTLVSKWDRKSGCPDIDNGKLLLEHCHGKSLEKLAKLYGIGRSTVYDRIVKARKANQ